MMRQPPRGGKRELTRETQSSAVWHGYCTLQVSCHVDQRAAARASLEKVQVAHAWVGNLWGATWCYLMITHLIRKEDADQAQKAGNLRISCRSMR
jgi:hypothetical protein